MRLPLLVALLSVGCSGALPLEPCPPLPTAQVLTRSVSDASAPPLVMVQWEDTESYQVQAWREGAIVWESAGVSGVRWSPKPGLYHVRIGNWCSWGAWQSVNVR